MDQTKVNLTCTNCGKGKEFSGRDTTETMEKIGRCSWHFFKKRDGNIAGICPKFIASGTRE